MTGTTDEDGDMVAATDRTHRLRAIKHRAFLVRKRARDAASTQVQQAKDAGLRLVERLRPFQYEAARYPGEFIAGADEADPADSFLEVPPTIYTFWTGGNPLSDNRRRGLESLRAVNPDLGVVLVTPADLETHLLAGHPLHPAYPHLSLVHRSDYLRCYFMHFFGGGYADIKTYRTSWTAAWRRIQADPHAWALGYREVASRMTAQLPGRLGRDLRRHYPVLIGNGAYLLRPRTPFTTLWYAELGRRMDAYAEDLAQCPGDARGHNDGYPVPWTGLLGDIFHPLCLRFSDRLIHDDRIRPSFEDYL